MRSRSPASSSASAIGTYGYVHSRRLTPKGTRLARVQVQEGPSDPRDALIAPTDNPTDVNTLARLKAFILGGADTRAEVRNILSLESLQERYARMMREQRDVTPAMGGVVEGQTVRVDGAESLARAEDSEDSEGTGRP